MSQEKLLWRWQELKQEEAKLKSAVELKSWTSKLKVLQAKVQEGEKETGYLLQKISTGEQRVSQLEQKINELTEQSSEKKEKLYTSKGGSLKELLTMQQALLKQEEQSQETEKMYWEITRQIEDYKKRIAELKQVIRSLKKEYNEGVREYQKIKEQYNLKLAELLSKQEEVKEQLQPQVRKLAEAAEKRYPLNFVAMLRNGACTGCRIGVSVNLVREVKEGKGYYHCDNCGRLLINPS